MKYELVSSVLTQYRFATLQEKIKYVQVPYPK